MRNKSTNRQKHPGRTSDLAEIRSLLSRLLAVLDHHLPFRRDDFLTRREMEAVLKISRSTLDDLIKNNGIPYLRIGCLVRFRLRDVHRYFTARCSHLPAATTRPQPNSPRP